MGIVILHRPLGLSDLSEEKAARNWFTVLRNRTLVSHGDLVVGRYSVLPFYKELEDDIQLKGATLINSYQQHRFVADMRNWAPLLEGVTPKTWYRLEDLPERGPFVLKGETNSRKDRWDTHMFAETKQEAIRVALRLQEDSLISNQQIYIRQYVPLKWLATGLNGLPITEEYRFFVCDGQILSWGFYWSSHVGDLVGPVPNKGIEAVPFVKEAIKAIAPNIRFFVMDVARTAAGDWTVIELNDGQMSGLSENDPNELYAHLNLVLNAVRP